METINTIRFHKSLAKFYIKWFQDCHDSAVYCRLNGNSTRERYYLDRAGEYLTIIMENWDAIEFFSVGDRAFVYDSTLPEEFRGYE